MKTFAFALTLTAILGGPALAGQCQDDLKKIDTALKTEEIAPDQKAQVKDMRNSGRGSVQGRQRAGRRRRRHRSQGHAQRRVSAQVSKASTARMMAASADIHTPDTSSSRRG